ncbi:hypothetical protein GY45DRAFT_1372140 [Cubamyces sp. BRFM 1775]|nr:hypothetical protein GY45DRAFT_1372140 [Cubamyces sp. BRFM 1775]
MSTSADSALVAELASSATYGYCCTSVAALLAYYYLTTLDEEFKHYSKRKFTLATLLYISNRYIPLVFAIYESPQSFSRNRTSAWLSDVSAYLGHFHSCTAEAGIQIGLEFLQYFPWAIFSALRTYALQRKPSWAVVVLIFSLAPVIVSATLKWSVFLLNTTLNFSHMSAVAPILARVPMIIADVIVILITWKTQYRAYSLSKGLPNPMRLTTIVLRDGTIYFVVLTILNTLQLLFEEIQVLTTGGLGQAQSSDLVVFVEPITAILISEFLTHLRDAASGPEILSSANTLEFRIIGSIGASLPGPNEDVTLSGAEEGSLSDTENSEDDPTGEAVGSRAESEQLPRGHPDV